MYAQGFACGSIHGDKTQIDREKSLNDFKNGKISILVATDVASRGLDIPNVQYVIIYDMPQNIDQYVHRIGRTGRIGNKGTAIVFIDDVNKPVINELKKLLAESNQMIPDWLDNTLRSPLKDASSLSNTFTSRFNNPKPSD